ncbi:hypothetical protein BY996DRAFT_7084219 [Phakopsora pachyrhizi]|nr:hypothetical protein BY996DRAFT_7084219 [Phakopsora pachyrhizi]
MKILLTILSFFQLYFLIETSYYPFYDATVESLKTSIEKLEDILTSNFKVQHENNINLMLDYMIEFQSEAVFNNNNMVERLRRLQNHATNLKTHVGIYLTKRNKNPLITSAEKSANHLMLEKLYDLIESIIKEKMTYELLPGNAI